MFCAEHARNIADQEVFAWSDKSHDTGGRFEQRWRRRRLSTSDSRAEDEGVKQIEQLIKSAEMQVEAIRDARQQLKKR
jgi:hypothetical protein